MGFPTLGGKESNEFNQIPNESASIQKEWSKAPGIQTWLAAKRRPWRKQGKWDGEGTGGLERQALHGQTLVYHAIFPLIRPAGTFSLGEKAAKRRRLKVPCASVCSSGLGAAAGGLVTVFLSRQVVNLPKFKVCKEDLLKKPAKFLLPC